MTSAKESPDDGANFKTKWDLSYVKPRDRFSYFREGICQAFFAHSPIPPADGRLSAIVETASLDNGILSTIDTTPHQVTRTRSDFASIPGDFFSLSFTRSGGVNGIASGASFHQEENQLCLVSVDAIESFDIIDHDRYSVIALIFKKSKLRDIKQDHRYLILDGCIDATIASCVKLAGSKIADSSRIQLDCLMDASISLLNARLVGDPDFFDEVSSERSTSEGVSLVIEEYVARHLEDPLLTAEFVATRFDISTRYVQKLFAARGTTFAAFVTELRLERAARDLSDPNISADVAEIALRWGFSDLSTFHRNFKQRFDDTPKQMRKRLRLTSDKNK